MMMGGLSDFCRASHTPRHTLLERRDIRPGTSWLGTVLPKGKPVPTITYTLGVQFRTVLCSCHEVASWYVDKGRGQTFFFGEYYTVRGTHKMKGKRTHIVAYLTP